MGKINMIDSNEQTANVCFVEPHPDDAVRQTGGTIAELAKDFKVSILTLSLGQMGAGDPSIRRREAENAARVLGVEPLFLDFIDTQIQPDLESIMKLTRLFREKVFDVIFAPYSQKGQYSLYGNSAHPDHYNTGILVHEAVSRTNFNKIDPNPPYRVSQLFYYLLPEGVIPDTLVPISDNAMELALTAAQEYKSQNSYTGLIPFNEFLRIKRLRYHPNLGCRLPPGYSYSEGFVSAMPRVMTTSSLRAQIL